MVVIEGTLTKDARQDASPGSFSSNQTANWIISSTTASSRFGTGIHMSDLGSIPEGAVINSATLTVDVIGTAQDDVLATVSAHDSASPPNLLNNATQDIWQRSPDTSATVAWSGTSLGAGPEAIDVTTIVQELVDIAGWGSGNGSIVFLLKGDDSATARSLYIGTDDGGTAPTLSIDYNPITEGVVSTTDTATVPVNCVAGDLLVLASVFNQGGQMNLMTAPTGMVGTAQFNTLGQNVQAGVWYRFCDGTETTSTTFQVNDMTGGGVKQTQIMHVPKVAGRDWMFVDTETGSETSADHVMTAITTAEGPVFHCAALGVGGGGFTWASEAFTETFEDTSSGVSAYWYDDVAGTVGTTASASNGNGGWVHSAFETNSSFPDVDIVSSGSVITHIQANGTVEVSILVTSSGIKHPTLSTEEGTKYVLRQLPWYEVAAVPPDFKPEEPWRTFNQTVFAQQNAYIYTDGTVALVPAVNRVVRTVVAGAKLDVYSAEDITAMHEAGWEIPDGTRYDYE